MVNDACSTGEGELAEIVNALVRIEWQGRKLGYLPDLLRPGAYGWNPNTHNFGELIQAQIRYLKGEQTLRHATLHDLD
jgi:hypothetical protein